MWSLAERDAMEKMLFVPKSPLRTALEKFCDDRAIARARECAEAMRSDPPHIYRSIQYGAKAELYEELLADLERECEKVSTGANPVRE